MKKTLLSLIALFPLLINAQTFNSTDTVWIPDNGSEVFDSVMVSGLPTAIDSLYGLTGMCFDITHTYDSDLQLRLKSPNGNTIFIANRIGGSNDDFTGTCLAENGAGGFLVNGTPPFTGVFIPLESLNQLNNGQDPNGMWYFCIQDVAGIDTGNVHTFTLTFDSNPPPSPGPPPILCTFCSCPGGAADCDLLPDMTSSSLSILKDINPVTHLSAFEIPGNLNFDNATPNIGRGPLEIMGIDSCYCDTVPVNCSLIICPNGQPPKQLVKQIIYQRVNNSDTLAQYERNAGTMSYHPSHGHIHVDHWADFTLRTPTSNPDATTWPIVGNGTKTSFCLINLGDCDNEFGYCVDTSGTALHQADIPNSGLGFFTGCGLHQGIYVGSLDIYVVGLNTGIDLTGVCNGDYYIVSITDPDNNMLESNELNNWVAVPVTLNQQTQAPSASHTVNSVNGVEITDSATNLVNATLYTWNFGDGTQPDSNVNPVSHTYASNGTYYATLAVYSPCGVYTKTDTMVVTSVGIKNLSADNTYITASPNPAKANIDIEFNLIKPDQISIELFDMAGKKITNLINKQEAKGMHSINLNPKEKGIKTGTYLLRLSTTSNKYIQKIEIVD